jgi:hypothetical protein
MAPKAPFKGRPASDITQFARECLDDTSESDIRTLLMYLLDMDADCLRQVSVEKPTENPNGLQPEALIEKMDLVMKMVIESPQVLASETIYQMTMDMFENYVLRLHQPNYVQYVIYRLTCGSSKRCDDFLSLLLNILHDSQADPIARREAVSYVVSFVVRCPDLNWLHSARTGKYLVSFMHTLDVQASSSDRLLVTLCLQSLMYLFCWESDRWRAFVNDPELVWISGSMKSLLAILEKYEGVLGVVNKDILVMAAPISRRVSMEISDYISESLEKYFGPTRTLLPPAWRPLVGSSLLTPYSPFDPESLRNFHRSAPLLRPLVKEWSSPAPCADAPRKPVKSFAGTDEGWNFHPLTSAYSPIFTGMRSPDIHGETSDTDMAMAGLDLGPNLVLSRIMSNERFARGDSQTNL